LWPEVGGAYNLTTEQAYIRSFQAHETEHRWLGFGRMRWNEKNNILWTTKYQDPVKCEEKKESDLF